MEKINEEIIKLTGFITRFKDGDGFHFHYNAETASGKEISTGISVSKDYFYGEDSHNEEKFTVVDKCDEFVHGFKLGINSHGQYLFIREEDGAVMPYVFDFATDFNELGFAMVGKNSEVSWIDRNFNYVDGKGTKWEVDSKRLYSFSGWKSVSAFSEGDIPLSKCCDKDGKVAYMGTDGQLKTFSNYSGKSLYANTFFTSDSDDFDQLGHAIADKSSCPKVLFAAGKYMLQSDLVKEAVATGMVDEIAKGKEANRLVLGKQD